MIKLIVIAVMTLTSFVRVKSQAHGENPGNLPSIIPPSPEVASLVSSGRTSTGMFTGAASANIPLYDLKVGSLSVPIALSYSTNGTRVNDIASRVGMGWNLVAGGSISRVVHDEEDENILTTQLAPVNFETDPEAAFQYALHANLEYYDTERDEYSFSVNGLSGKFYFDNNGVVRLTECSNVKIFREGDAIIIINTDGIRYEFGKNSVIERTRDVKTNGITRANKIKKTGWFLTKIISPDGDEINLTYKPIYIKTNLGPNQSVILKTVDPLFPGSPSPGCVALCEEQWSAVGFSKVDYDSYYLSKIETSNGLGAHFVYEDRPDASGDNRLILFTVFSSNGYDQPKVIARYSFQYNDFTVGNDLNQRFYLKKVIQSTNETTPQNITHELLYNDPSVLPSQESMDQDYYGYYNGPKYNQNFFPKPYNPQDYDNGYSGADRSPDHAKTKAGTLQKVVYPTGGYEEFEYEANSITEYVQGGTTYLNSLSFSGLTGAGGTGAWNACDLATYTQNLTSTGQSALITFSTIHNTSGPSQGSASACNPDGIHFLSYLEVWNTTLNTMVFEARHREYTQYYADTYTVFLTSGSTYEVRLKIKGLSTKCFVTVDYDPSSSSSYVNVAACGLRVKSIKSFDPITGKHNTKYFKYALPDQLSKSSGVGYSKPEYSADYWAGGYCNNPSNQQMFLCGGGLGMLQISSSSLYRKNSFNGAPVGYSYVIESDDLNMVNGGIIHQFVAIHEEIVPKVILNQKLYTHLSTAATPDINGTEWRTSYFKLIGGSMVIVKDVSNYYSFDTRIDHSYTNYVVRKRWEPGAIEAFDVRIRLGSFDINSYDHRSRWWHPTSSVTTVYDELGNNPVTNTVYYTYSSLTHLEPTEVQTINSKGETLTETIKYPHDFAFSPYTTMVTKNMVSIPLEKVSKNSGVQTSVYKKEYALFNTVPQPQYIKGVFGAGAIESRLQYVSYNNKGMVNQVSKINDAPVSYLYNYMSSLPVAEVKNAQLAEIAYTSFEGDDNGQWSISGTKYNGGVTGIKYFTGTLSRSISNTFLPYVVTAWVQGSMTVNGLMGTLLVTKGSWKLYKWNIGTGIGSLSISGTAIDEVRLHPASSTMTTYAYNAFIGVSATCDENNRITYYEYDGFNRLRLVLDQDKNVMKRFCYNYAGQTENCTTGTNGCSNTFPNWQNTTQTRCQVNSIGENTGYVEFEQKDMNTCSPSYLQTQWLQGSYNPQACTVMEDITVTSSNPQGLSGFIAIYTNTTTNVVTQFNIPTATNVQTLGSLPEGTYTLVISNPNNNILLLFGTGCIYQDGVTSVTFYNVNISGCHAISIEWNW